MAVALALLACTPDPPVYLQPYPGFSLGDATELVRSLRYVRGDGVCWAVGMVKRDMISGYVLAPVPESACATAPVGVSRAEAPEVTP